MVSVARVLTRATLVSTNQPGLRAVAPIFQINVVNSREIRNYAQRAYTFSVMAFQCML